MSNEPKHPPGFIIIPAIEWCWTRAMEAIQAMNAPPGSYRTCLTRRDGGIGPKRDFGAHMLLAADKEYE